MSLQQIHPELFLLPAYADSPNPNTINFAANIINRENNFAQGTSDIKFQIQAPESTIVPTSTKFTVFLFFGDNFYTSYKSFTASYDQFPLISYKYSKPGTYKPLLIIYSYDLKSKLFKFLDPIKVEKLNLPNPIANGVISNRFEDNKNNMVTISFDARTSYDPANIFNGNALSYSWDFGDGAKAEAKAIIDHIYTSYGTYTPSLIVKTPDGRTSTKLTFNAIEISKETIIPYDEYSKASDLKIDIISKINQAPLLDSKVTYSITSDNPYLPLSKKKFTVFLFYGDNFYRDYYNFTAPYSGFPQTIVHEYKKAGKYTPLLIAYSGDLTDKIFRFLDPIVVNQAQGDKPIAQGIIDERIDSRESNIVTVNFNGSGSFDPRNNSHENLTYVWDYGDGFTETISSKFNQHIYGSPGTFIPSLTVRANDGRLSDKYQLSPIIISKAVVCLSSRDTWVNVGICQANCGGINAEQLQVNGCDEERFIPCTSPTCKANSFTILNEYIEANSFISLLADNGGFADKTHLNYRFIISSAGEEAREQIYQNSKFYLNHPGPHNVTLEIYDQSFKASTYTQTINVAEANKAPIAKAQANIYLGEVPLSVNFDASESLDPENSTLSYEWNLGDGTSANGKTLSHNFDKIGTYKTWLKVTDNRGLSSQINLPDIVVEEKNYPPIAKFVKNVFDCAVDSNGQVALEYKTDGSFACNIELDALFSSDPNGNISNYQWTIDHYDPVTEANQAIQLVQSTNPQFVYKFTKFGNYNINLKVTDTKGLNSDYNSTLTILEPPPILKPELKNRVDNLDLGSSLMDFSAASSIYYRNEVELSPGAEYLDYLWNWGDGLSSNGLELRHNYNSPGVYSPVLSVYRKDDPEKKILASRNLESLVVTTKIPIVGSLSFDSLINLEENGTSSVKGVTIGPVNNEEYKWIYRSYEKDLNGKTVLIDKSNEINNSYGELNSSILDAPQSFTEAGQYQLVHQLDDKPILSETLTVIANQIPIPKLQVTHDTGSNFVSVSAEDSYDPKDYTIESYHWDFGDGSEANGINATHTYANNNVYYIKLTVIDSKGQVANAYSKAIIVGNYSSNIGDSIPPYKAEIDSEDGDIEIPYDLKAKLNLQSTDDPVSSFDSITDNKNTNSNIPIRDLSLPNTAGPCSGGSCDCKKSYAEDISISSINFLFGNTAHYKEKGGALVEIKGSNFCRNEHNVKIKVDGGGFIDRPSTFIDNNTILAKIRSEDFKGNNITIKVNQQAANSSFYYAEKVFANNTVNPSNKTYDVLDGNSVKIDFNIDNLFFDESTNFGNGYHYFKDGYPTVFTSDALIISKKLNLTTHTANQARLMLHLSGNRFDGIRVWINNVLVLSRDPAPGNKFYEMVSDPFSISSGALDLKIKIIGPSDNGVQVKAVTIYTAPIKPFINNFKLNLLPGSTKNKRRVDILMNTTPNTKLQAVHINRKSTKGTYKDKYIILQAENKISNGTTGNVELIFDEVNFKPGTHCTYFYLTNGSKSDEQMEEYIKNNLVKPFNQARSSDQYAAINENTFKYLKDNAIPIKHGVCFNEDHNVTLSIKSPTEFIEQANNQPLMIQLQSDAPEPRIKANWEYEVKLLNSENETSATKIIDLPFTINGTESIWFPVLKDYIGDYNLLIKTRYFDPSTLLTYVGETSAAIHIIDDVSPKAKVVTENINKLILEPNDNPANKASFLGQYSYDPNRATFDSKINDGIGSYSWITEFKSLESSPDATFNSITSTYDPNASTYYIGPRKEPGIYRAQLTVKDFFNNSDTAKSDTVQVIRPGQNLVASLSVNHADKIFEPDLNGKKEITLKGRVKFITAKNNKPNSLSYKFIYGDDSEESGSINLSQIPVNQYIDLPELTNRKHSYEEGEYDPRLEVSASFPDGHSEAWTVSAGTLTIAKLPSYVAFTPIIANLNPKDIPNPGFVADLKVKSKAIYKTTIESFGWDFGDGTTWTYSGNNPTADFMKNSVTDKQHAYNDLGIFQIKFWVKTVDAAQPIVFALKPLEIKDTPAPIFKSLTVNQQTTNIKVNDEEIITIAGEIETKINLQRLELRVIAKGSNDVVFSKTYTETVPKKFSETFNDLYLEPGNYVLALLAYDQLEQAGSGTLEFAVGKTSKATSSLDFANLNSILNKTTYVNRFEYEIPVKVLRRIKEFIVYSSGKEIQKYRNIVPNSAEVNSNILIAKLEEDKNTLSYRAILPNGKIINLGPHQVVLDSTAPFLEIETPVNHSIYKHAKIIVSGTIQDDNIDRITYRLNSNEYEEASLTIDPNDFGIANFEIKLPENNILESPEVNFLEVGTIDKAGNERYSNLYFISASKDDPQLIEFDSLNLKKYFSLCPEGTEYDEGEGRCYFPGEKECNYYNDNHISLISKYYPNNAFDVESFQILPFFNATSGVISDTFGHFEARQGKPFALKFDLAVCDVNSTNIGEVGNTEANFKMDYPVINYQAFGSAPIVQRDSRAMIYQSFTYPFYLYNRGGNYYTYNFRANLVGRSATVPYIGWGGLNNKLSADQTKIFDFSADTMRGQWPLGYYGFHNDVGFDSYTGMLAAEQFTNAAIEDNIEIWINQGETSITVNNITPAPNPILSNGTLLNSITIEATIASYFPLKNVDNFRFFYLSDIEEELRISYELPNSLTPIPNPEKKSRYLYKLLVTVLTSSAKTVKPRDSIRIDLYEKPRQFIGTNVLTSTTYLLKVNETPLRLMYIYDFREISDDEHHTSYGSKKFKITMFHRVDASDKEEQGTTPKYLQYFTTTKYDRDGNEIGKMSFEELGFEISKSSIIGGPPDAPTSYYITEYTSFGPDNGGTIFKEPIDLEFRIDMTSYFAAKGLYTGPITYYNEDGIAAITVGKNSYDYSGYRIAPKPIQLKNYDISLDKIIFEPVSFVNNPRRIYQNTNDIHIFGDYEFDEEIKEFIDFRFALGYSPEYALNARGTRTLKYKRTDFPSGIYEGNNVGAPTIVFDVSPIPVSLEIKTIGHSKHFSMLVDFSINKAEDALIKHKELTAIDTLQKVGMPFAALGRTSKDLIVELIGGYTDSSYKRNYLDSFFASANDLEFLNKKVNFIDYPQFEDPKQNSKYPKVTLKQSNEKVDLFLETYYSNILHKSVDPLEMEIQLFNELDTPVGFPLIITGTTIGETYLSGVDTKVRNFMKINLTKNAPEFKTKLLEAESISIKLLRNKEEYLVKMFDNDSSLIDQYYSVSDNDPDRYRKVEIKTDLQNRCWIELPSESNISANRRRHSHIVSDINELKKLKVKFESASKKGARLWVKQNDLFTNHTFNHGESYATQDFETINGQTLELDAINSTIKNVREGYLLLNRIDVPDKNKVDFNFVVSKATADPSVISSESDANTAVVCGITYLKDIADGDIIFDNSLLAGITNRVPAAKDYRVIITTEPDPESIYGVELYIDDLSTTLDNLADPLGTYISSRVSTLDGKYLELNLKDITSGQVGIEYILSAQLIHTPQPGREVRNPPVSRKFILVNDTEPTITFGTNGINDLGDPGSGNNGNEPNVIYAKANEDYQFDRTITFTGIKEEDVNKISLKLIDRATNKEAKDHQGNLINVVSSSPSTTANTDEYTYNISTLIPFTQVEDIKEYILEAYFDDQRLSQTADLFIIDDPVLKVKLPDFLEFPENEAEATLHLKANIENGFEREMNVEYITYINGDPEKGLEREDPYETEPIFGKQLEISQKFSRADFSNTSNRKGLVIVDDAIFIGSAIGVAGIYIIAKRKEIAKSFTDATQSVISLSQTLTEKNKISFGKQQPLFNFKVLSSDGTPVEYMDGSSNKYKLRVTSSLHSGEINLCQELDQTDECQSLGTSNYDLTTFEERGAFTFTLPNGQTKRLDKSYTTDLEIKSPTVIPGTNLGITILRGNYYDTNKDSRIFIGALAILLAKNSNDWCVSREVASLQGLANPKLAIPLIALFITQATNSRDSISSERINFNNHNYSFSNNDLGGIKYDLWRLMPKTESLSNPDSALGYCRSLAYHIANQNERLGLFRVFESRDARPTNTIAPYVNYKVYWLDQNSLVHIYQRHGFQENEVNYLGAKDTRFLFGTNPIKLIEDAIVKSSDTERGFISGSPDTTFQKVFSNFIGVSKIKVNELSKTLQVRTADAGLNEERKNAIETAFPLHPSFSGIKSSQ